MVEPLDDPEVISSEALRWEYRRQDHFINRYQALTRDQRSDEPLRRELRPVLDPHRRWTRLPVPRSTRWLDSVSCSIRACSHDGRQRLYRPRGALRRSSRSATTCSTSTSSTTSSHMASARSPGSTFRFATTSATASLVLPEDAPANGRLLLFRGAGGARIRGREPATRVVLFVASTVTVIPLLSRSRADTAGGPTRPGFFTSGVLDHARRVRRGNHSRTRSSFHPYHSDWKQ